MKTKEYVKKYNLRNGGVNSLNHEEFAFDFLLEFKATLELHKTFNNWGVSEFHRVIDLMRQKWDMIGNKTFGVLPENLWGYIYANFMKYKVMYFPEVVKAEQDAKNFNLEECRNFLAKHIPDYAQDINNAEFYFNQFNPHSRVSANHSLKKLSKVVFQYQGEYRKAIITAFKNLEKRLTAKAKGEAQKEAQKQKQRADEYYRMAHDFFYSFLDSLFSDNSLIIRVKKNLRTLGLDVEAKHNVDVVKKTYRQLAIKHHPDKGGSQSYFIKITEAKEFLIHYYERVDKDA